MQRADYSKKTFDIQYPFLLKAQPSNNEKPNRYWKNPVSIMNDLYYICSEWYEKGSNNDRPYYEKWLRKMKS